MPMRADLAHWKPPHNVLNRINVGLLRRQREITNHHVVDHAPAKRADLKPWETPVC